MKTPFLKIAASLAAVLWASLPVCGANAIGTFDSGGNRSSSSSCTNNGSLGWIDSAPAASPSFVSKPGYTGQLAEPTHLTLTSSPIALSETATAQLGGWVSLDDGTVSPVHGDEIVWNGTAFPLASISNGVAIPSAVYTNTLALVSGAYLGLQNSLNLWVMDTMPDNFGAYAGDGLPDAWQIQYFGPPPNAGAAPTANPFGTGNNWFKYLAGLNPTNPASVFSFRIQRGASGGTDLVFSPRLSSRAYDVLCSSNLDHSAWAVLSNAPAVDHADVRTVSVPASSEKQKFYQIRISLPTP